MFLSFSPSLKSIEKNKNTQHSVFVLKRAFARLPFSVSEPVGACWEQDFCSDR